MFIRRPSLRISRKRGTFFMLVNKNKLLRCRRRDRMLRSFYMHTFIRLFINVTFSFPSQTCLIEIKLCFVWSVCVYMVVSGGASQTLSVLISLHHCYSISKHNFSRCDRRSCVLFFTLIVSHFSSICPDLMRFKRLCVHVCFI